MNDRPPVRDWLTDWDHMDPRWTEDPFAIWDEIRTSACPVAETARYRGAYLPTRFADIRDIAFDTDTFSSRQVVIREQVPDAFGGAPPITSDPPKHAWARRALMPPFSPHEVKKQMTRMRAICDELIDRFEYGETFDGAADYAQHIPVRVIAAMLGLPESDADMFRDWIHKILVAGITDVEANVQGLIEITEYFEEQVAARRAEPRDDLITRVMGLTYEDGEPFKETHILGTLRLILIAGIDTTWSAIGASIWHLAQHPQDRARLAGDPSLIPNAVEEFLRAFAPVSMGRLIVKDCEVGGRRMPAGSTLLLAFPAANRDPDRFERPDVVDIDRADAHRHAAFGIGIHRCIGMHLARAEIRVALEALLTRIPNFSLAGETTWSQGPIRGPRVMPLRIDRPRP